MKVKTESEMLPVKQEYTNGQTDSTESTSLLSAPHPDFSNPSINYSSMATAATMPLTSTPDTISWTSAFLRMNWLAIPMLLQYTFSFFIFVLSYFLNRLGAEEDNPNYHDAYPSIAFMLNSVILLVFAALSTIGNLICKKISGPDTEETRQDITRFFKNGVRFSVVAAAVTAIPLVFSEEIFRATDLDPGVAAIAGTFLRLYSPVLIFLYLRGVLEQLMFSFQKQFYAMIIGIISFSIGVFLALGLGFGDFSMPNWGLDGLIFAFGAEAVIFFTLLAIYVGIDQTFKPYKFYESLFSIFFIDQNEWAQIKELFQYGWKITFTVLMEILALLAMNSIIGAIGGDALDAWSFASQLLFLALIVIYAYATAGLQEIERTFNTPNIASRVAWSGLLANILPILIMCAVLTAYPEILMLYSADVSEEVMKMVYILMLLTSGIVILDMLRYHFIFGLRAHDDYNKPAIIFTSCLWGGVVLAALAGLLAPSPLNIYGVVSSWLLSLFITDISLAHRVYETLNFLATSHPLIEASAPATLSHLEAASPELDSANQDPTSDDFTSPRARFCPDPMTGMNYILNL